MQRSSLLAEAGGRTGAVPSLMLVRLSALMERSSGRPEVTIALIDGPVAAGIPELAHASMSIIDQGGGCQVTNSAACLHGTHIAGILVARRGSVAPAIAPDCTLLVRPLLPELTPQNTVPSASPAALADAVASCVRARARIINISADLLGGAVADEPELTDALDLAARQGALVVAAAGNQSAIASSPISRHRWVIPVAACDNFGHPSAFSNFGRSIGRGLLAPGEQVRSAGPDGAVSRFSGSSVAAPFVTGAAALLWSLFPGTSASAIREALCGLDSGRLIPRLLDAERAYQKLAAQSN
jgi:subtilisin family serine protease